MKYVKLNTVDVEGASHVVVAQERQLPAVPGQRARGGRGGREEFVLMEWCGEEKYSVGLPLWGQWHGCVCVCVCLCERERGREREKATHSQTHTHTHSHTGAESSLELPALSHCTLFTVSLPHLTHLWTCHSAYLSSSCPGVKGGLVLPRKPHTPLLHDNETGHLIIPLSLQVRFHSRTKTQE